LHREDNESTMGPQTEVSYRRSPRRELACGVSLPQANRGPVLRTYSYSESVTRHELCYEQAD